MEILEDEDNKHSAHTDSQASRQTLITSGILFVTTYLFLFLGMSLRPSVYDEGLILTGAMRVAAGQIPYRDFYANYGPVQFYLLAGIFRFLGQSILVERLTCIVIEALLVTAIYLVLSDYCRRFIAVSTSVLIAIWLIGATGGSPLISALLLNIVGCCLVLPVFTGTASADAGCRCGCWAGVPGSL